MKLKMHDDDFWFCFGAARRMFQNNNKLCLFWPAEPFHSSPTGLQKEMRWEKNDIAPFSTAAPQQQLSEYKTQMLLRRLSME